MVLIGKSCLAAAALEDKQLLRTAFNGKVFWVNLAEIRDETEHKDRIIQELHRYDCFMKALKKALYRYIFFYYVFLLKDQLYIFKNETHCRTFIFF